MVDVKAADVKGAHQNEHYQPVKISTNTSIEIKNNQNGKPLIRQSLPEPGECFGDRTAP
jgi:hypothetical protein